MIHTRVYLKAGRQSKITLKVILPAVLENIVNINIYPCVHSFYMRQMTLTMQCNV